MPIYQYVCDACDYMFERVQSFNDEPVSTCPNCDSGSVRRVISSVGVIFKGSGWYITDNRRQISDKSKPKLTDGKDNSRDSSEKKAATDKQEPSSKKEASTAKADA